MRGQTPAAALAQTAASRIVNAATAGKRIAVTPTTGATANKRRGDIPFREADGENIRPLFFRVHLIYSQILKNLRMKIGSEEQQTLFQQNG
ncbi:MAG: hypothetical protein HYW90_03070 [Candidatus Sungbacteria bacterium]|nr:hypothetical protein [Candidatus Sungbacteria bacterium]